MEELERLRQITARLRAPDGCPWDREQDYGSMRSSLIEEAHEVVAAVNEQSMVDLKEELGDLLFLVVFYVQLAEERGDFTFSQVATGIADKLIRRHPHVFSDTSVDSVDQIVENWEKIKETEKTPPGILDGVKASFPALLRAYKTQNKAARAGFDWKNADGALDKIQEEATELRKELDREDRNSDRVESELGDLLFSVVNLSRFLSVEPETALSGSVDRFSARIRKMEEYSRSMGRALSDMDEKQLDVLWNRAKAELNDLA